MMTPLLINDLIVSAIAGERMIEFLYESIFMYAQFYCAVENGSGPERTYDASLSSGLNKAILYKYAYLVEMSLYSWKTFQLAKLPFEDSSPKISLLEAELTII